MKTKFDVICRLNAAAKLYRDETGTIEELNPMILEIGRLFAELALERGRHAFVHFHTDPVAVPQQMPLVHPANATNPLNPLSFRN